MKGFCAKLKSFELFNLFKADSGLIYTLTKETIQEQENVECERERERGGIIHFWSPHSFLEMEE